MENIKSYEEALNMLGKEKPSYLDDMPKNEQAYHKLCTICEALNLGHENKDRRYYPWWFMKDLRAGIASHGSGSSPSCMVSMVGFRICSFDIDTALYFGSDPFIKLWQDYLL